MCQTNKVCSNLYTPFLSKLIAPIGQACFHKNSQLAPVICNVPVVAVRQALATDRLKATVRTPTLWAVC
jgi:hypothetical protein